MKKEKKMTINKQKQVMKEQVKSKYGLSNTEFNDLVMHYAQLGIIGIADIKKQIDKDVEDAGKENFFLTEEVA
tara:strand:- start:428 stop:646 length:219 start_codon:yes stop_codon:yes gene_type:complete